MPLETLLLAAVRRALPAFVLTALLLTASIVHPLAAAAGQASAADVTVQDCRTSKPPAGFHRSLVVAIHASGNLPPSWADSPFIPWIVCWQNAGFDPAFSSRGYGQRWHGLFAMTVGEMQTIQGPWMSNERDELILSAACYVHGWDACPKVTGNTRTTQQLIAGLRWIWLNYGSPIVAWRHIVATGRFDSYPRPGTDDTPTNTPLRLCPIAGATSYTDSLGAPRGVGGYHPHWGNDVVAPIGRTVRAPFAGLAVAHDDGWFGGKYVTVVGTEGYVRNGHLSRFGRLGWVKAGTIIGYVGETGDARSPHDHFEWHPWDVPRSLHRSPFGFTRILDAIDPFPFLNTVCH